MIIFEFEVSCDEKISSYASVMSFTTTRGLFYDLVPVFASSYFPMTQCWLRYNLLCLQIDLLLSRHSLEKAEVTSQFDLAEGAVNSSARRELATMGSLMSRFFCICFIFQLFLLLICAFIILMGQCLTPSWYIIIVLSALIQL